MFDTAYDRFDSETKIAFNGEDYKPTLREVLRRETTPSEVHWNKIFFSDVKCGDIIRLKDPDGTPVTHEDGKEEFVAKSDAYLDEYGLLCFEI